MAKSMYDHVTTFVINHIDERLPGTLNFHFKNVKVDWDEVYKYWEMYIKQMKKEGIMDARGEILPSL